MKKLSLVLAAGLFLMSCSNNAETTHTHDQMNDMTSGNKIAKGPVDPVCGEPRQADWTDFTVVGDKDTLWFCCAHDKAAFDKDPEKYAKR